jgi:hypothetical protein
MNFVTEVGLNSQNVMATCGELEQQRSRLTKILLPGRGGALGGGKGVNRGEEVERSGGTLYQ